MKSEQQEIYVRHGRPSAPHIVSPYSGTNANRQGRISANEI